MMLKLKRFIAIVAFELAELLTFIMADHMPLQAIHIQEALMADLASLLTKYFN